MSVPQPALPISRVGGLCNVLHRSEALSPGSYQTPLMKNSQLFCFVFHHRLVSNKRREQQGEDKCSFFVFLLSDFNTLDRGSNI